MSFTITVDSCCNISDSYKKDHDIRIIPFSFIHEDNIYRDDNAALSGNTSAVTAHAPEISEYVDFWRRILSEGKPVLHISAGSSFGKAYANAVTACDILTMQNSNAEIYTVDSRSAACGCTLLLYMAVGMRSGGTAAADCADAINREKMHINGFMLCDDAVSAYKHGLLSFPSMLRAAVTGEDVLCSLSDSFGGVFCSGNAFEQLSELTSQCCSENSLPVCIAYSSDRTPAEKLAQMLSVRYGFRNIELFGMTVSQSFLLPGGTIALFFHGKLTDGKVFSCRKRSADVQLISRPAYL